MNPLAGLARMRPGVERRRCSTWDRTGGNSDAFSIMPGATLVVAEDSGAGQITHIWTTILTPTLFWGRELVLRMFWDGEDSPSVEVPYGDFFGVGNCLTAPFSSAVLEMAPRDGLAMHSWFPMPFARGFRIEIENQSQFPVPSLYCYVDYESWAEADDSLGRFHAWWNRRRGPGLAGPADGTYELGLNPSADDNYVLLSTTGRGHYVGASLNVYSDDGGWYGEGDDMIFVDSRAWPPALHGTGTEDYFGTSWSPAETFSFPYYGQPVADNEDWSGFSSIYRFHVADPVPFTESVHVTIEQGHANDRKDDYSSVAYWYQQGRTEPLPALPGVADRLPPWPEHWMRRVNEVHLRYAMALLDPASVPNAGGYSAAAQRLMHAINQRDWDEMDAILAWMAQAPSPVPGPAQPPAPTGILAAARGLGEDAIAALAQDRDLDEVVGEVVAAWQTGFDADAAGDAGLVFGVRVVEGESESAWQVVVADGACTLRRGSEGHERLTIVSDLAALIQFTNGELDAWEAAIRGRLLGLGDTSMALRIPALFRVGVVRM